MSWDLYAEFFTGLFIALNPVASLTCFMTLTSHLSESERRSFANRAMIAATVAVVASILLGQAILAMFGVSLGAFRCAAGIALFLIGLKMMREGPEKPKLDGLPSNDLEIVPFAIPIVVGPGVFGFVISQTENMPGIMDEALFLTLGVLGVGTQWVIMVYGHGLTKILRKKGMDVATRLMGLILMAIGMDGLAKGIMRLFPGLGH